MILHLREADVNTRTWTHVLKTNLDLIQLDSKTKKFKKKMNKKTKQKGGQMLRMALFVELMIWRCIE